MTAPASIAAPLPLLPRNHRADRPLRVILTVMAFLAALALLGSRMSMRAYQGFNTDMASFATVQILPTTPEMRDSVAAKAEQALAAFSPIRVDDSRARDLLTPWLGGTNLPDGITLPLLYTLSAKSDGDIDRLRAILSETGLDYSVETPQRWRKSLARTGSRIAGLSGLIMILTIAGSFATTVFATQSAMASESQTISVFTQIGAPDRFIRDLFVRRALRIGATAAAMGIALAGLVALILTIIGRAGSSTLVPKLGLAVSDIIALIILGFVLSGLGALAAGTSVQSLLDAGRKSA